MLYEAKLVAGASFSEDPDQMGYVQVKFDRKVRWARPMFGFGEVQVPTKEWIDKYSPDGQVGVYVSEVNNQPYLVYTGFIFYADQLPAEAMVNYAYRRLHVFTENWKVYSDDKANENLLVIENIDGTKLSIDRTAGSEKILIEEGTNTYEMASGGVKVNGDYVALGALAEFFNTYKASLGLGNMGAPVPLHPTALAAWNIDYALPNKYRSNNS